MKGSPGSERTELIPMESQNPKIGAVESRRRSPAPPRRSHADRRHPLKPSPCSKVPKGLVRKVLGEEVCRVLRRVNIGQSQRLVGHQLLKVQAPELDALGLPAKSGP
eukprot:13981623-Alexandrium_andersonii.AAC.1